MIDVKYENGAISMCIEKTVIDTDTIREICAGWIYDIDFASFEPSQEQVRQIIDVLNADKGFSDAVMSVGNHYMRLMEDVLSDFSIEECVKSALSKVTLGHGNTSINEKTEHTEPDANDDGDGTNVTVEVLYQADDPVIHQGDGNVRCAENDHDTAATAENLTEETLYSADIPVRDCQATPANTSEHRPWLRYENGELFC